MGAMARKHGSEWGKYMLPGERERETERERERELFVRLRL